MVMRSFVLIALAAAAVAASAFHFFDLTAMDDPSKHPPRRLQISLGETVRDFMQVNHLPAEVGHTDTPDKNRYSVAVDVIADTGPVVFWDNWIIPAITIGTQHFELPPGRTLFIDQEAGRIKSFSFTPGAKALPLQETNRLVKPMLDWFLANGWKPEVPNSVTLGLTDQDPDFARSSGKIYAQLMDDSRNQLSVTVTNLASVPSQPSYIIAPSPARPKHDPPVYVVRVGFYWAHRNDLSYGDLIFPRRIFVNGDKNNFLRLRPWVEDPDWTPEKHGMVYLGGTGEGKRWGLPKR